MKSNKKKTHGGYRVGAGRKSKLGKTKSRRIPEEITNEDIRLLASYKNRLACYEMRVEDGVLFIASKNQYSNHIAADKLLINDIKNYFLVKMSGCNLKQEGILENDLLLVKQTKDLQNDNIVIVATDNGKAVIKKLIKEKDKIRLICHNQNCPDIEIDKNSLDRIWGVVTRLIRDYQPISA